MIKVNVISGFLGAGKTTLIRYLAAALIANNEKVVILENEFGEVGIDGKTFELEGLEVFEISSGCICCTLKSDFMHTLIDIAEKISPDRILVEPSGIFIPSEIEDIFKDSRVSSKLTLGSAIAVVDCVNFLKQRHRYGFFFENQISYVDKLILSKVEGIEPHTIVEIINRLQEIKPIAEIVTQSWRVMTGAGLLNLLSNQAIAAPPQCGGIISNNGSNPYHTNHSDYMNQFDNTGHSHHINHPSDNSCNLQHNHESHEFMAFGISPAQVFTIDSLSEKLTILATGYYGSIVRAKGHVLDTENGLDFDYVNGLFEIRKSIKSRTPAISFIGEGLDKAGIKLFFGQNSEM